MIIKLVIFDLDGTLVDAYKAVAGSLNYTLKEMGRAEVDDESIKRAVGWGDRNLIATFLGEDGLDAALSIFRQHHSRALKQGTTFLPGARALLQTLKEKRYTLAVASNRPSRFTHIILKQLRIDGVFEYVLCGDQVKRPKPAGDILGRIMARLSVPADQALYVGDMTVDIETGNEAGVRTVAVATGSHTKEELTALKPYKVIERVDEILGLLT